MDYRLKTFEDEASRRLGYLVTEFGFTGPVVSDTSIRWTTGRTLRYIRGTTWVDTTLDLGPMGEEYVRTSVRVADHAARNDLGSNAAHTAYQMRKGLDQQSRAVRDFLTAAGG